MWNQLHQNWAKYKVDGYGGYIVRFKRLENKNNASNWMHQMTPSGWSAKFITDGIHSKDRPLLKSLWFYLMVNLEAIFEILRSSTFAEFLLEVVRKKYCGKNIYSMLQYTVLNRFSNSCLQIIDKMHSKWSNSKFSKHTMFVPFEFQDVESI